MSEDIHFKACEKNNDRRVILREARTSKVPRNGIQESVGCSKIVIKSGPHKKRLGASSASFWSRIMILRY